MTLQLPHLQANSGTSSDHQQPVDLPEYYTTKDPKHGINDICCMCEWILDIHFQKHITHIWTKTADGSTKHYPLLFHPKIYVSRENTRDFEPQTLTEIAFHLATFENIISIKFVQVYEDATCITPIWALELQLYSFHVLHQTVSKLQLQNYEVYNIDINFRQQFFLDTRSFPMTKCHLTTRKAGYGNLDYRIRNQFDFIDPYELPIDRHGKTISCMELVKIKTIDDIELVDYDMPPLLVCRVELEINAKSTFENKDDPLKSIKLDFYYYKTDVTEPYELIGSEKQILLEFKELIDLHDPDIFQIPQGDKFTLNYLAYRAKRNRITNQFWMGRLDYPMYHRKQVAPQIFVTYGAIMTKEMVYYIPGRIHLDYDNSFILYEGDIDGLIDLSRMSATPMERTSRSSIGTTLTGIELVVNQDRKLRTLLPALVPNEEKFKSGASLLDADNGGLIYPGTPGIHDRVWALDFTSMYPFIMLNENIGSETILCEHDECLTKHLVPSIGYHICDKLESVVTRTMRIMLKKRILLKKLKQSEDISEEYRERYKKMDIDLKWILVCCFGYLGFRKTRFGTIESHQAVTAYARHILQQSMHIAREHGFILLCGITDSLFIRAKDPKDDTQEKIFQIQAAIERKIKIPIEIEGKFNWVVFCHVRNYPEVAALNRYFGYFDHGEMKIRGIRSRQSRVTNLEFEFQHKVLEILRPAMTPDQFLDLIPRCYAELRVYRDYIINEEVDVRDLLIKLKSHVGAGNYMSRTVQAIATDQYLDHGNDITAGQSMQYLVVDDRARDDTRVLIEPRLNRLLQFDPSANIKYDKQYYVKILDNALVELVEAPQMQYFGRLKYDIHGEEKTLDDIFEISGEMGEINYTTIRTDKNVEDLGEVFSMVEEDTDKSKRKYEEGDYRSRSPVSIQEQREFVETAKKKQKTREKEIEKFWEVDAADGQEKKFLDKKTGKKSKLKNMNLSSFFE